MTTKSDWSSGQIGPGRNQEILRIRGMGGEIRQVSIVFSGSSTDARKSHLRIEYDGTSVAYPTCDQIKYSHGTDQSGTTLANVTAYSKWDKAYGYYIRPRSAFDSQATVIAENGDKGNNTNFNAITLYDT